MKAFVFFVVVVLAFVAFLHWREWQESHAAQSGPEAGSESASASLTTSASALPTPPQTGVSEKPNSNGPVVRGRPTELRTVIPEKPAPAPAAPVAGSDEDAREFIVFLYHVEPGVGALAHGGFYQRNSLPPPDYRSPLEVRPGDPSREEPTRGWTESGRIFVAGIPEGYAEGDRFHGWLVRTGAKTIYNDEGKPRTIAAYRIAPKPQSASASPKPGEWMFRKYRRTLEHPEGR